MKNKTSTLRGIAIAMAASLCLTGSALVLAGCGGSQSDPAAQSSPAGENDQSSPAAGLTGKEATDILLGKQIHGAVKVPTKVTLTAVGYDSQLVDEIRYNENGVCLEVDTDNDGSEEKVTYILDENGWPKTNTNAYGGKTATWSMEQTEYNLENGTVTLVTTYRGQDGEYQGWTNTRQMTLSEDLTHINKIQWEYKKADGSTDRDTAAFDSQNRLTAYTCSGNKDDLKLSYKKNDDTIRLNVTGKLRNTEITPQEWNLTYDKDGNLLYAEDLSGQETIRIEYATLTSPADYARTTTARSMVDYLILSISDLADRNHDIADPEPETNDEQETDNEPDADAGPETDTEPETDTAEDTTGEEE